MQKQTKNSQQRQRPGLVARVLCNGKGGPVLNTMSDVVLADPYASRARRRFFRGDPAVSERYLQHKPGLSDADWRSFFEAASGIKGPLRLAEDVRELSRWELKRALPEYDIPSTKSWRITARWGSRTFSSDNYLLVDALLPNALRDVLTGQPSLEDAEAAASWLHEVRQELPAKATLRVVYVPYNSSSVWTQNAGVAASWVRDLQDARWVYGNDASGPYLPAQLLARSDPARPDALVARLPDELVTTLESCGLTFGSSVPEVASIDRLRREGPIATVQRLLELVEHALADTTEDVDGRAELLGILRTDALLPVLTLRLIQTRLTGGVATILDLRQGEQLVYTATETIPALQQQIEQTENQIGLLLGKNPDDSSRLGMAGASKSRTSYSSILVFL
jgi:hypothetical protein